MSYEINTSVNKVLVDKSPARLISIFIAVESKSNILPRFYPVRISNEDEFHYYFPDVKISYDSSLSTAFNLLSHGYVLIVMNVYKCNTPITARVFKDSSFRYYDDRLEYNNINTTLHSDDNLAIKIDMLNFGVDAYILLEHMIDGVRSNVLIYTHNEIPINSINYRAGSAHRISPSLSVEGKITAIMKILTTDENYSARLNEDGHTISIASTYPFTSINTYKNCNPIQWDPIYQNDYLNYVHYNDRSFDLKSRYNSDIDELEVNIQLLNNGEYSISVVKRYNDNEMSAIETITDTLDNIEDNVNSNSKFIYLEIHDTLIPGKYLLTNMQYEYSVSDQDYIDGFTYIRSLNEDEDTTLFDANMVYEPDRNSQSIQDCILETFNSMNYPTIKILEFYNNGTEADTSFTAYFTPGTFKYQGREYSLKELYLVLLISGKLNSNYSDITSSSYTCTECPHYVNDCKVYPLFTTMNELKVLLNKNEYDICDVILLSVINVELNRSKIDINKYFIYDLIEKLSNYFIDYLKYDPKLVLNGFNKIDNKVMISFEHYFKTKKKVEAIKILLEVE